MTFFVLLLKEKKWGGRSTKIEMFLEDIVKRVGRLVKCARDKQGKLSNIQSILEQGFYLLVELVKQAIRTIVRLLFFCFYNLKLPPQSIKTQSLRSVIAPCASNPYFRPCVHSVLISYEAQSLLSLLSSCSLRSAVSAVATRPCRCPFFPLPMQTANHFLGSLLYRARHSMELVLPV